MPPGGGMRTLGAMLVIMALAPPASAQGFELPKPAEVCLAFHVYGSDCEEAIRGYEVGVSIGEMFYIEAEYLGLETAMQLSIERIRRAIQRFEYHRLRRTG